MFLFCESLGRTNNEEVVIVVKSQIADAIDRVVSVGIHPVLREQGFKKQGRTFHRHVGDLYHAVYVQGSRYNEFDSGQFTINLGIASPEIAAMRLGGERVKNPASLRNILLSTRIGCLLPPKKDQWWVIGPDTDLSGLAQQVGEALARHGLEFFERPTFQSTQTLLDALERDELSTSLFGATTIREELHALLLHRAGYVDDAEAVLANLLVGIEHKGYLRGYVNRIRELGARLGFAI